MRKKIFFLLFLVSSIGWAAPSSLQKIALEVTQKEAAVRGLRKGTEARVELRSPQKTARAFLYLHGFSASPKESSPLVEDLAGRTKDNAYFPRFRGHGMEGSEGLRSVTLADWEAETRDALALARQMGEKVVVVAMSTGASLVIPAIVEDPSAISHLVLLSPNFCLSRWDAELMRLPWIGASLAKFFLGPYRQWKGSNADHDYYWTTKYPSEILVEVVKAAAKARNADLEKIKIPTLVAFSPKDEVINIASVQDQFERLGPQNKQLLSMPEAENAHNLSGAILSPLNSKILERKIADFLVDSE